MTSKEDLACENDRLSAEVTRLKTGLEDVQKSLQSLERTYVQSKGTFTLARYGELKDMIKKLTSEENMKKVSSKGMYHLLK